MYVKSAFVLSLLLAFSARSDDLYGPTLGIVPDTRGSALRPIRGIPGAATIGDAVDLGPDAASIAIAPRQSRAIVMTGSGVRLVFIQPDGTLSSTDAGMPASFQPAAIGFSPSGSIAALYDASTSAVWLSGGKAVRVDTRPLPDTIDLLAVSDRTESLIAGTLRSGGDSVFILDGKGAYKALAGFKNVTDLTFLGASGDLAVCDSGAKQILLIRDAFSNGAAEMVLDLSGSAEAPLRIASSMDGSLLAVLASGAPPPDPTRRRTTEAGRVSIRHTNVVGLLRIADRQWTAIECHCAATELAPLTGNAVFRLTQRTDQPLWILDSDGAAPRLVFIPAVRP